MVTMGKLAVTLAVLGQLTLIDTGKTVVVWIRPADLSLS